MTPGTLPDRQELAADGFFQDPYPYYARLRAHDGPYFLPHQMDTSTGGILLFSRYRDAMAIFSCARGMSKDLHSTRAEGKQSPFDMNLLHRDGPDHLRLRRLVSEWFAVRAVERLRPLIEAIARSLLEPLLGKAEFELITEFAEPLPLKVIASLIGIPGADLPQLRAWSLQLGDGFDSLIGNEAIAKRQQQVMEAFMAYVAELIAQQQARPDDGSLLSFLVQNSPRQINRDELLAMVAFLIFAGHETTTNLIGSAVWLLWSHPQQLALLRAQPALTQRAVEEVLRYESPEQRSSFRIAQEPLEINTCRLEPGQQIGVIIGSANRDETVFERADEFDIRRAPHPHLAFGIGVHNCLGKTLARVETELALRLLLENAPTLALCDAAPMWRRNSFFRGLQSLRVAPGEA